MRVLITGICGFVGSVLARSLPQYIDNLEIVGLDNFSRPGSEQNRARLQNGSTRFYYGDIRVASDLESLPQVDWVIDAAANPSVLAGVNAGTSSRQLMEHNLVGTLNLLELCKRQHSGFVLLSTSRVYSLTKLSRLRVIEQDGAFVPAPDERNVPGLTTNGVNEVFSTEAPVSLYGSAKLASETIALDYSSAFGFPLFINRCGVLAGAGQFGKPDQGIFSFWIHSYRRRRPLKYVGFAGSGHQVRDCLHPQDLAELLASQLRRPEKGGTVLNVSGGMSSSISLFQLSQWCGQRFGKHPIGSDAQERPFDVPWLVLDAAKAEKAWDWQPKIKRDSIFEEIAKHAEENPHWLELSTGT
jgi:CDP-paratose 2-epimerase